MLVAWSNFKGSQQMKTRINIIAKFPPMQYLRLNSYYTIRQIQTKYVSDIQTSSKEGEKGIFTPLLLVIIEMRA